MIPWNILPKDVRKSLLILIVLSGSASSSACCPMVCDPPPPPPTTPRLTPSMTPMICDPPPPPAITHSPTSPASITPMICDPAPPPSPTPTPKIAASITPMICDPPPPPALTQQSRPTLTPSAQTHLQLESLQMAFDQTLTGAGVQGTIVDRTGIPLSGIKVSAKARGPALDTWTDQNGDFFLRLPTPDSYTVVARDDRSSAISLTLNLHDLAVVEWRELAGEPQSSLPLAEIRTVNIVWEDSLAFNAESQWGRARYRWSVSGGTMLGAGERVVWEPPANPGRYLLQVIADWGRTGLAVDSIVLVVN